MNFPEEGDLVLGIVDNILKTSVFVKLVDYELEGVINFSEIAAGRIRNIRDYVKPKQKIVCMVLRIDETTRHVDLSLRRVKTKEKKSVLDQHQKEKDLMVLVKLICKDNPEECITAIKKEKDLSVFFNDILIGDEKENISFLRKIKFSEPEKLIKLIKEKVRVKKVRVKVGLELHTDSETGLEDIKKILIRDDVEISYISAPKYSLILEGTDYKSANKKLDEILEEITKKAKQLKVEIKINK
ncbi:MAG: S1 RNA-binding domain-containing protein [archaeon]